MILNAAELSILEDIKEVLKPYKELTVALSGEKEVTIPLIAPTMHNLLSRQLADKEVNSDFIQKIKRVMWRGFYTLPHYWIQDLRC